MHHHAILILGEKTRAIAHVPQDCRVSSTDVHVTELDRFSIDDARELKREANNRPVVSQKRHFLIQVNEIAREAQQALLKLFEDPPSTAQFYVILPHEHSLLPTLRSRFHIIEVTDPDEADASAFDAFLRMSKSDRLLEVQKRTKDKDAVWVQGILNGAELYSSQKQITEVLQDTLMVQSYVHTRGASQKMLLEHLALTL